jgi:hypothetical protein
VRELLDGRHIASKMGTAFECLSATDAGWPYAAMVSIGELLAVGPSSMRLAIWSSSTTAGNLQRDRRCVLSLVHAGISFQIRCAAFPVGELSQNEEPDLAIFELSVVDILEDQASYATLTSGITYALHQPDAVLERWTRTIQTLRDISRNSE